MFAEPFGDDDDDDDADDEPLTNLATKIPKKEAEDDIFGSEDKPKPAEKRKATVKAKAVPAKKAKATVTKAKGPAAKVAKPQEKKKREVEENAALKTAQLVLRYSTAYPFTLEARKFIKCILCNETFDDPLAFRNHMDLQHEEVDKSDLVNINTEKSVTRVDITYLHCKLCKTPIESLEMFANHLANIHDLPTVDKVRWLVPVRLETNRYVCVLCEKKYTGWSQLFQHSGTHFSRYMCSGCGKNFETRHGLLQHLRNHHPHEFDVFCIRCKQIFPSKQSLKRHTASEEYCFPYCCNICKQRFLFWERREEHLVEVHCIAKKSYPCSECDRVFEKRTLYYRHFKAAHTGDFKCSYCDKQYASNKQLKLHIKHKHID